MNVTKHIEKLERSQAKLSVTVPATEAKTVYAKILGEYVKNARIDGFRKGKVPSTVLERKYGKEIQADAAGQIMEEAFKTAVEGETLVPISYADPQLEAVPVFEDGKDFSFVMTYDVFPDVPVCDVNGITIEVPEIVVSVEDEKRELEAVRERNALVVDVPSGAAVQTGSIVTVNHCELDEAGNPTAGSERQDFVFEVGSGHNIYKFDDELIGLTAGHEKIIHKTFPADFDYAEIAGSTKTIRVSVTKIKEKKLPELDDDLAQDVSEKFKTLADLKADIQAKLKARAEHGRKSLVEKAIIQELLSRVSIELPASMVEAELAMRMRNTMSRMGMNPDNGMNPDILSKLYDEWRPSAETSIKTRLILNTLVTDKGYEVSDADLEAEYAKMAEGSSMSVNEIKAEYETRGMVDYLKDRIKDDKLMLDLEKSVTSKKGKKITLLDLDKEIA